MTYSSIDHLKTIIDEGIRYARLAQLSGSRNLEKAIPENLIPNQIKLAHEIESLRRLGIGIPAKSILSQESLRCLGIGIPAKSILSQESLQRLGIGIPAKSILTQISPTASACKKIFDELDIKKHIKYRLSLAKCNHLVSIVDQIDFSEIVIFYSDLPSGAKLEEKLIPFLEHKRLEIDESIKGLSQAQELILAAILKRDQDNFVKWNSVDNNTIKASKSRSKTRLIKRGLITRNPAKTTKEVKLTRLGRYAARRILADTNG